MSNPIKNRACLNSECSLYGKKDSGNIVRHGFIYKKRGRTRRYRCDVCQSTVAATKGTPYYRLQHSRNAFDRVAAMCVEGVSKSATARIMKISWNTASRWVERAAAAAKVFNKQMTKGYDLSRSSAATLHTATASKVSEDNGNIEDVFSMLVVKDKLYYQRPSSLKRRILGASDLDDKEKGKALRFIEDLG
tara:strand:+ start:187 stop:759 length:573 start_codon:yes stop_codon:yes gene_type:complete